MLHIQNVLVAHNPSPEAETALTRARLLARRFGAHLHVCTTEADPDVIEPAARLAHGIEESHHASGEPGSARALIELAERLVADLIVVGPDERGGIERALLGSVAEEVVRHASCPVLALPSSGEAGPGSPEVETILVPVDFSEHAREAIGYGKELAALFNASLHLLHVAETMYQSPFDAFRGGRREEERHAELAARLEALYRDAEGPVRTDLHAIVRTGLVAYEILHYANEIDASLIVMSTHGLTGLRHVIVGSVAEHVVRSAPCPVFTVKSFGRSLLTHAAP